VPSNPFGAAEAIDVVAPDQRPDPELHAAVTALLHEHLGTVVAAEEWVQHVEHDPSIPRWYVRFGCDGRDAATIYFDLHQRSLHYEVYFLPDPPKRRDEIHALLLRAGLSTYAVHPAIGVDGDVYLVGRTLLEHLDADELDRIIGAIYEFTERWFPTIVAMAFR
jgi:hypothetical protein